MNRTFFCLLLAYLAAFLMMNFPDLNFPDLCDKYVKLINKYPSEGDIPTEEFPPDEVSIGKFCQDLFEAEMAVKKLSYAPGRRAWLKSFRQRF